MNLRSTTSQANGNDLHVIGLNVIVYKSSPKSQRGGAKALTTIGSTSKYWTGRPSVVSVSVLIALFFVLANSGSALDYWHPTAHYIFPAGGQQGTTVEFKVGAQFAYENAQFDMVGDGIEAVDQIQEIETLRLRATLRTKPMTMKPELYPRD